MYPFQIPMDEALRVQVGEAAACIQQLKVVSEMLYGRY
jgi:hypothetical protein